MLNELLRLQHKNPKKVIGLMSGTSADGVDACLVEISGNGIHTKINILGFETYPYDETTRSSILEACNPETGTVDKVCQLNFHLGKLFANAAISIANKAHIPIKDIDLIGSHGQTIYHIPNPETISKSKVRSNNYVTVHPHLNLPHQGGGIQGNNEYSPPLVGGVRGGGELLHNFKGETWDLPHIRSTLQIGEPSVIAQETGVTTVADFRQRDIAAGGQGAPLVPYVDFILFRDKERGRALQNIGGIANVTILPKNSGREEFGISFADNLYKDAIHSGIKDLDILATVTAFTAHTIADSYKQWILSKHYLSEVILSGGGSHNNTLIKFFRQYLKPTIQVHTIDKYGISPNTKEALAFAILANETISGNPNNVPSATGAREAIIMGKIIPGKL